MLRTLFWGAVACAGLTSAAVAQQDAYVIGVTGAMTGPSAGTLGPAVEGLRIYVDRLNAAGGVNGRQIKLMLQDDSSEPSKACTLRVSLLNPATARVGY